MNFLLRTAYPVALEQAVGNESKDTDPVTDEKPTLQGLIGEDSSAKSSSSEEGERENDDAGIARRSASDPSVKSQVSVGCHSDVTEEDGWIIIPYKELNEDWNNAPDIQLLRSADRSFLFPGEQIHILACLATSKQDAEVITPFKVAAAISRNCNGKQSSNSQNESVASDTIAADGDDESNTKSDESIGNGELQPTERNDSQEDILATESLIRMENQKRKTELLLESFRNSHFFVRISDSDMPLWSKKVNLPTSDAASGKALTGSSNLNAIIDGGNFDGNLAGGLARNSVRCFSLSNGDIVVLLQVNVGTDLMRDPVLEVLQFEQLSSESAFSKRNRITDTHEDPYGELLTWLLPLDRTLPPRPSAVLNSVPSIGGVSHRPTLSASGSQIFSFSHFRSYSMPSIPQSSIPPSAALPSTMKSKFDIEEINEFTIEKPGKSQDIGTGALSSFRGVPLEAERYSVQCGLGGMHLPGKRWRKKVEIIQPLEIYTFAADCNSEDLLCVQIKNVSPMHLPDIVIFLDSINIIFEEAPKDGPPLCLPITCIEGGNGHSLPNLALRRGEEHSFILKPAAVASKDLKGVGSKDLHQMQSHGGASRLSTIVTTKGGDGTSSSNSHRYAVLVSCRCNYTESKLFFKKPTSWQPHARKDLMISVASEISDQSFSDDRKISQLPVQTLTLETSNLTMEDMTLTVLAPASLTAPPSVVSLNSAPTSPVSPFAGFPEFAERGSSMQRLSSMPVQESRKEKESSGVRSVSLTDRTTPVPDMLPNSELGCTHLWLQSTVPLGCIPAQSSATVKLELLPLTDGIITLDTLQIAAKEKGLTYVPQHSLKIHATSSVATGIV